MPRKKPPELTFQKHIADYLIREHEYGVLEQADITDTEHFIAEDQLWAFLKASQADTLKKLTDNYGTDAREEVFKALRKELEHTPLWMLFRQGLPVRGLELRLFYPKPRSAASASAVKYAENRITFRPHFYFGDMNQEIDFVFYLNGLPIVALELKHEANQNVHDAVTQFTKRDHTLKIFQHPFLYLAADTSHAMAATDPRKEQNFRWHNMGLTNTPTNPNEYPIEYLYREVLSQVQLLDSLSFFLVRVPEREAEDDKPARPASTIFPRYHQSRLVRRVAEDITAHFATAGDIGKKYLADHSAGSGKTLSICWLADRLHSLFKPGTNEKLVTTGSSGGGGQGQSSGHHGGRGPGSSLEDPSSSPPELSGGMYGGCSAGGSKGGMNGYGKRGSLGLNLSIIASYSFARDWDDETRRAY